MSDLRQLLRQLRRRPGTPVFATLTLALGVVATASVYVIVRDVLLEELPYPEADRLVLIWRGTSETPDQRGALSPGDWLDLRERAGAFEEVAAVNPYSTTLIGDDGVPEQVTLGAVTGEFFGTVGLTPSLGRAIGPGDDGPRQGPDDVRPMVLARDYWQRRFGGDPGVIGRSLRLGGVLHTVVGVLPPEGRFFMPRSSGMTDDLQGWIPFDVEYRNQPRDGAYLRVVARLREGVGRERLDAELEALSARLRADHRVHDEAGFRLRAVPLEEEVVAHIRPVLTVLSIAAVVVLLVACVNVMALLLVRFMNRRTETAVRAALGAGRARLVALFLAESAVVCLGGTALGLLLARPAVRGLLALEPGIVPRAELVSMDASILLVALALAVITTLLCGIAPALLSTFDRMTPLLRSRDAGWSGSARRLRQLLLLVQVAASFALIYGASSLLGSMLRVRSADLGFEPEAVLTTEVVLPFGSYRETSGWVSFFSSLEDRLAALPDVVAVGLTSDLPTTGASPPEPWLPADADASESWGSRTALHRIVSSGYFAAAGIEVRQGRGFELSDGPSDSPVVVVDRTLARDLARDGGRIIGRVIDFTRHRFDDGYYVERAGARVVGVVDDVPHEHPEAAPPGTIYAPHAQYPLWSMTTVLRGAGDALPRAPGVREVVAELDPGLPVTDVRTLESVVADALATTRFLMALITGLAVVVMGLTAGGLFGLVAETVLQRRRELGIRLALGARERGVVGLVVLGGTTVVLLGLLPGIVLVPWVGEALREATGDGPLWDPSALGAAFFLVASVAILACYLPARRASRIRPAATLRED